MDNKFFEENLIRLRREFHQIPEPSLKEFKTSELIKKILDQNNIKNVVVAQTGIIAFIEGENKNNILAFRADIDALPIEEKTGFEFSSKNQGFMHACGHDFHISIILNLAIYFSKNKPGVSLLFIFQPGEEGSGGAKLMLNDNIWSYFGKPSLIFGYHVWPSLETGKIAFCEGEAWAGSVEFEVIFKGKGGHGAYPHDTSDLVFLFSDWYINVQNFISRKIDVRELTLLTCGKIFGANKSNIIPSNLVSGGTLRYFKDEIKNKILNFSENYAKNLANLYNAEAELSILSDYIPIYNNKETSKKIFDLISQKKEELSSFSFFPELLNAEKVLVADDIAYFMKDIGKGVYFFLGVKNKNKNINLSLHTNNFNPDENALIYGFEFFKFLIKNYLYLL